jgi:hypothetical protein
MYKIKQYSKDKAKQLGVQIKPSTNPKKKLDVFKEGIKVASIGDLKYKDYPTYLQENKQLAEERRRLYKIRHKNDINKLNSSGYYANRILW